MKGYEKRAWKAFCWTMMILLQLSQPLNMFWKKIMAFWAPYLIMELLHVRALWKIFREMLSGPYLKLIFLVIMN